MVSMLHAHASKTYGGVRESANNSLHVNVNYISYLLSHSLQINSVFCYSHIYLGGKQQKENYISQNHCYFGIITLFSETFHGPQGISSFKKKLKTSGNKCLYCGDPFIQTGILINNQKESLGCYLLTTN